MDSPWLVQSAWQVYLAKYRHLRTNQQVLFTNLQLQTTQQRPKTQDQCAGGCDQSHQMGPHSLETQQRRSPTRGRGQYKKLSPLPTSRQTISTHSPESGSARISRAPGSCEAGQGRTAPITTPHTPCTTQHTRFTPIRTFYHHFQCHKVHPNAWSHRLRRDHGRRRGAGSSPWQAEAGKPPNTNAHLGS